MTKTVSTRLLVIGSGPAGLTAAIYAARAGLSPVVVQGIQPGGQLTTTTDVENYPGFRAVIQGPWLVDEMQAQAEHVGTRFEWDHIADVDVTHRPFRVTGDGGTTYTCDTLVIATGAQAKWLGLPSEEAMKGKGASACATCDGFFLSRQEGGGDRRRQQRGRGGALPDQPQPRRHVDPPPRQPARRENPPGPPVRPSGHQARLAQRSRRIHRRRRSRNPCRARPPRPAVRRGQPPRCRRCIRRDRPPPRDRSVPGQAAARCRRLTSRWRPVRPARACPASLPAAT